MALLSNYTNTIQLSSLKAENLNGGQSGDAPIYACRAWVVFNGNGTIGQNQTIRGSGNVSSVFKNSNGDYTVIFTINMPDTSYAVFGNASYTYPGGAVFDVVVPYYTSLPTTSSVRIATGQGGSIRDSDSVTVCIYR